MSCHDTSLRIATRYSVVDLPLFDAHDARLRPPPSIGRVSQEEEELNAEVAAEERAEALYGGRTPTGGAAAVAPAPEHSSDGSEAAKGGDGGGRGIAAQGGEGAAVFDTAAALLLPHDAAGAPHGGAHLPRLAHYPTAPSPSLLAAAASARGHEHSGDERPKPLDRSISEVRQPSNVNHNTTTRESCVKR